MNKNIIIIIMLVFIAIGSFAKGMVEYDITALALVDDRDKGKDTNSFGGDYFVFSNTITDKRGDTRTEFDPGSKPGYNGSAACIRFKYALDPNMDGIYAGVGTNINADLSVRDFSDYIGITFYAKGYGIINVRLGTEESRSSFNDYQYPVGLKSDWTLYQIPFSEFKHPGNGKNYKFKPAQIFNIVFSSPYEKGARAEIFIDNIGFFKGTIKQSAGKPEIAETDKSSPRTEDKSGAVSIEKKLSQKKMDEVMGKRIAVVGLDSQNIDSKVTGIVVDFIINAFVNSGSVKVVDRSSIEKILKEQAFQMQDFVDNTKVMEIGRLLGAEFVVTGGLNKIEQTVYLNIKLISVKTAEILGSSVTSAPEKSDYVDLCNNAVLKLFM